MFNEQKIISAENNFAELKKYISHINMKKILLVHGNSFYKLPLADFFLSLEIPVVHFTDFSPNPIYESVLNGLKIYRKNNCDGIIAVGGGSAIDVAKCIKLFANMNDSVDCLKQKIIPNNIPLTAIPTTAGTGSESTHFAVIYRNGEKFSVADKSALPSAVMFDPTFLMTLPLYQKKAGLLDALCHAIESSWAVKSSEESRSFSFESIRLICAYKDSYLTENPSENCRAYIFYASRLAGMAINLSKTTAGHALSYKLTSKFGISHGHSAALCVARVWNYMNQNLNCAINEELKIQLPQTFQRLAECMGFKNVDSAISGFQKFLTDLNLAEPLDINFDEKDIEDLVESVNLERLSNNPIILDKAAISNIYKLILSGKF